MIEKYLKRKGSRYLLVDEFFELSLSQKIALVDEMVVHDEVTENERDRFFYFPKRSAVNVSDYGDGNSLYNCLVVSILQHSPKDSIRDIPVVGVRVLNKKARQADEREKAAVIVNQ
jgi:hypothetical protein